MNPTLQADIDKIIGTENALRVTVTRHPLARFASAWAQKFRVNGEFDKGRSTWLKNWPTLAGYLLDSESVDASHRISFKDFLDFFLDTSSPSKV